MPLTLEVSYFNSYYVKRLADVPYIPVAFAERNYPSTGLISAGSLAIFTTPGVAIGIPSIGMIIEGAGVTASTKVVTYDAANNRGTFDKDIIFTASTYTFNNNWTGPQVSNPDEDWYIEESRIRGGYNNTSTDYGFKISWGTNYRDIKLWYD